MTGVSNCYSECVSRLTSFGEGFQNKYNGAVRWTVDNHVRFVEDLSLNDSNGVLCKIGKVVLGAIAMLVSIPLSYVVQGASYAWNTVTGCCCSRTEPDNRLPIDANVY